MAHGSDGGFVQFWDVEDLKEQKAKLEIRGQHADQILDIAFEPNGKYIATAGRGKKIQVFDPRERKTVSVRLLLLCVSLRFFMPSIATHCRSSSPLNAIATLA